MEGEEDEDDNFDFGKAKMDFFKKRSREILMNENDLEYTGKPYKLDQAYKNLKNALKNPLIVQLFIIACSENWRGKGHEGDTMNIVKM